jgi:hypothetical protein
MNGPKKHIHKRVTTRTAVKSKPTLESAAALRIYEQIQELTAQDTSLEIKSKFLAKSAERLLKDLSEVQDKLIKCAEKRRDVQLQRDWKTKLFKQHAAGVRTKAIPLHQFDRPVLHKPKSSLKFNPHFVHPSKQVEVSDDEVFQDQLFPTAEQLNPNSEQGRTAQDSQALLDAQLHAGDFEL